MEKNTSYYICAAGTYTILEGEGYLHSITINTANAVGIITVYDAASAVAVKKIAIIAAASTCGTYTYDVQLSTGLTIVCAGASDITVSYQGT